MKKNIFALLFSLCITAIPSLTFAIADIAVIGGYTPYGNIEFYE